MLRDIIKKEVLDTITSPKFVFTFLLCTILILLSVYTGINNYKAELKEYNAAVSLNRKNLESQTGYAALAGLGTKIVKSPHVLSTIITGIQEAVGRVATVNIAYDPSLVDSKYNSNPVFAIFGELDLTFIIKIVLSLFAILFTYDAIVGEKERGTLKLALSNPVPRDRLILGKVIGGFTSLMIPLIIPLLLGLIMLIAWPGINLSGDDWIRISLIFLVFLLYLSVFFTLGLFVSARSSRSSTSLLVLLFIWVTFVTIIPKAAVMVAGQMYPIPSVHEISAEKDAFLQEIQKTAIQERQDWFRDNPNDGTPEWGEKVKKWAEDLQQDLTAQIDAKNASLEEEYQAKRRKQQMLAVNFSRVSPASALMFASMSLGRTGINEHERFQNSVKNYKPVFTKWVNAKMMSNINMQTGVEDKPPELGDMPVHEFVPEGLGDSFRRVIWDFVLMLFLIVFFFTGSFVSFIRYDVR